MTDLTPEREAEWRKDAETACQWITKHYRDTGSDNAPARILVLLDALGKAEQESADLRTRLAVVLAEANETHASSQAFSALRGELRAPTDPTKEGDHA